MTDGTAPGELIAIYLATGAPLTTVNTDGLRAVFDAGRASVVPDNELQQTVAQVIEFIEQQTRVSIGKDAGKHSGMASDSVNHILTMLNHPRLVVRAAEVRAAVPTVPDRDAIAEALALTLDVKRTGGVVYAPMRNSYLSAADAVIALYNGTP